MYACAYREMLMCTCLSMSIWDTCMYARTYVRTYVCTCVCICASWTFVTNTHVCFYVRACVYVWMDTTKSTRPMATTTNPTQFTTYVRDNLRSWQLAFVCMCMNAYREIDEVNGHDNKSHPVRRLLQIRIYARRTFVTTYVRVYVYECIPRNRRGRWPRQKSQASLMSAGGTPLGRPRTPLLCDVTHSYVRHDSLINVTWLSHIDI